MSMGTNSCRSCLHLSHQGTIVEAAGVRRIVTLKLELIDDRDIVVSHPESGFSVTYRKTCNEPMLIAIDGIDRVADGVKGEVLGSSLESRLSKGPRTRLAKVLTLSAPSPLVLYDPLQSRALALAAFQASASIS